MRFFKQNRIKTKFDHRNKFYTSICGIRIKTKIEKMKRTINKPAHGKTR